MRNILKLAFVASLAIAAVGCSKYESFTEPAAAHVYTDADFEGDSIISVKALKAAFSDLDSYEGYYPDYSTNIGRVVEDDIVIRGKVISSDEDGNIYKSLFLLDHHEDGTAAIELRLFASNFPYYPVGSMVYVKLKGLTIGNYRSMLNIGVESVNAEYANTQIENSITLAEHIFLGEDVGMNSADTLVVDANSYDELSYLDLGRLVRFEGIESRWGSAMWYAYQTSYPSYFLSSDNSFDWMSGMEGGAGSDQLENPGLAYYGTNPNDQYSSLSRYYGTAWFSYNEDEASTENVGQYLLRTSGYARFRTQQLPADGAKVNITAIFTRYGRNAFTQDITADDTYTLYQLSMNHGSDIVEL